MVHIPFVPARLARFIRRRPRKMKTPSKKDKFDMKPEEYEEARRHFAATYAERERKNIPAAELSDEEIIRRLRGPLK